MLRIQSFQKIQYLNPYIEDIQLVEVTASPSSPFVTLGYPEATPELLIILSGGFTLSYRNNQYHITESSCFTHLQEPSKTTVTQNLRLVRVVFKPLGVLSLGWLTGLSSEELISRPLIGVSDFSNTTIARLASDLYGMTDIADMEALINHTLALREVMKSSPLSHLGDSCLAIPSVDDLSDQLCCSPRTLQRWFKNEMAISPKYFLRLLRFKQTLVHLAEPSPNHPIAVANTLGYYDHNHLIKEVQHFAQTTPGRLNFDHYLPAQISKV